MLNQNRLLILQYALGTLFRPGHHHWTYSQAFAGQTRTYAASAVGRGPPPRIALPPRAVPKTPSEVPPNPKDDAISSCNPARALVPAHGLEQQLPPHPPRRGGRWGGGGGGGGGCLE